MAKPLEYAKLVPGFLARYRLFVKGGIMAHGRNDMPVGFDTSLLNDLELNPPTEILGWSDPRKKIPRARFEGDKYVKGFVMKHMTRPEGPDHARDSLVHAGRYVSRILDLREEGMGEDEAVESADREMVRQSDFYLLSGFNKERYEDLSKSQRQGRLVMRDMTVDSPLDWRVLASNSA